MKKREIKRIKFEMKYRDDIESGKYKVETYDGKPVRIICWDAGTDYPIVIMDRDRHLGYRNRGGCAVYHQNEPLMLVEREKVELTGFENKVVDVIKQIKDYRIEIPRGDEMYEEENYKSIRRLAKELLAEAKKELEQDTVWRSTK